MSWRRAIAIGSFALATAWTSLASALPSSRLIFLRGAGTETCPPESEVREAVYTRLGYDPFNSYAPSTMLVEVTTATGGYSAHLKMIDQESVVRGDRAITARGDCHELLSALALTMSIAIDPESVTRSGPPEDAPPAERTVTPLPSIVPPTVPDAPRAEAPLPSPSRAAQLRVGLGPLASVGSAPALAVGGMLTIDGQFGLLFGGVEGRVDAPSSRAVSLGRVKSGLASGSLYAGIRGGPFFAAAVGSLGRVSATSSSVAEARDDSALYLGVGMLAGAAVPLSERFELRVRLELLTALLRNRLGISEQIAYSYPVISGNLALGLAFRFW